MATHKITNTDDGPRGFWHQDAVVMVEAGDTVDVSDMTDDEVKAAKATGYFKFGAAAAKAAAKDEPDA